MEDNIVSKFVTKVKDKLSKKQRIYPSVNEYAFSSEEIEDLSRLNNLKIQELKQDVFKKNISSSKEITSLSEVKLLSEDEEEFRMKELKDEQQSFDELDVLNKKEGIGKVENREVFLVEENKKELEDKFREISSLNKNSLDYVEEDNSNLGSEEHILDDVKLGEEERLESSEKELERKNSFIHLSDEHQAIVMEKWNCIDTTLLDKDILHGKDLLNHNYTITFADEASSFIRKIRHDYEIVICYLIGFNNEKKGICEKTIFSDRVEDEWKHLGSYIKILEKIRGVKK